MVCEIKTLELEAYKVSIAMISCGGSFVNSLGVALSHADWINRKKIKEAFPGYWSQYLHFYETMNKETK